MRQKYTSKHHASNIAIDLSLKYRHSEIYVYKVNEDDYGVCFGSEYLGDECDIVDIYVNGGFEGHD